MSNWKIEQLIFVDESAANEHAGNWKYTWAPSGIPFGSNQSKINKPLPRWSLFPAYTINGFIAWKIFHHNPSSNTVWVEFEKFIQFNILPHCRPYPGPRSIIIMDCAPIHISKVYITPANCL